MLLRIHFTTVRPRKGHRGVEGCIANQLKMNDVTNQS
jgi:hypothetical protein